MGNNNIIIITARPHQFLSQFGTGNYYYINGGLMYRFLVLSNMNKVHCASMWYQYRTADMAHYIFASSA